MSAWSLVRLQPGPPFPPIILFAVTIQGMIFDSSRAHFFPPIILFAVPIQGMVFDSSRPTFRFQVFNLRLLFADPPSGIMLNHLSPFPFPS